MTFAVVGCGALGSFYGAKLARSGQDVSFLLRSDYAVVRERGVTIHSVDGDFVAHPRCARDPSEIGVVDVVLVGLKTTANDQFARLLPPLVGPKTAVVTLQNGLGNEEQLAALFSPDQILGGLCFVCLNRIAPGVVHHIAHGRVVLGEFRGRAQQRTHDLAAVFRSAGITCDVTDDLARAHWEKLVWNIPFNGLGVAGAAGYDAVIAGHVPPDAPIGAPLPTNALLADPRWERLIRQLMREVILAARARGHDLADAIAENSVARTRNMGAYRASTLIDFERGQALELESLFLEPLRQARAAGVDTPRLDALCRVLTALSARNA